MSVLKFAVVREDFELEVDLSRRAKARRVLTVASGGCTALALRHALPALEVHAFDGNPAQLAHAQRKADAVVRGELAALNVGDASPGGLSQRGEFEKLFRVLRGALTEFVMPPSDLEAFFAEPSRAPALRAAWAASPYWAAAFEVAFAEGLLHAMFGPDATRHAAPGSYPGYFQRAFERGLARAPRHRLTPSSPGFRAPLAALGPLPSAPCQRPPQAGAPGFPVCSSSFAPGPHTLRLSNKALGLEQTVELTFEAGKTQTVNELAKGLIAVKVTPWAYVKLDGKQLGETPISARTVYEGVHLVELNNTNLNITRRLEVKVKAGETRVVSVNLEE